MLPEQEGVTRAADISENTEGVPTSGGGASENVEVGRSDGPEEPAGAVSDGQASTVLMQKDENGEEQVLDCPVCLSEITAKDACRTLCQHFFCTGCLVRSLECLAPRTHGSCPM